MSASPACLGAGDLVVLRDAKGRRHLVQLAAGGQLHTHHGVIAHDDLLGGPEGVVVCSSSGTPYLALRPVLADYVLSMPRGAAVVYPKDAAAIVAATDLAPGGRVVEAGAGSGALTCSLLRAVGERGRVFSYELRADFAAVARRNVDRFFGAPPPAWQLTVGDVGEALNAPDAPRGLDAVVLDLLAPWQVLGAAVGGLRPGGVFCSYVTTVTQLARVVESLRASGLVTEPLAAETLVRSWHVDGLAVRPDHRMVGHTGFLVTARRLAPGVTPPPVHRRAAKGAHRRAGGSADPAFPDPADAGAVPD